MTTIVQNYVQSLILKYPYWNRTLGADHFFVTCHDVGVRATEGVPLLVKNSIRVVCSPSYEIGFIPHKDVPLPQVLQPFALPAGGNDTENRKMLGFWAGHRNSEIRAVLASEWENDTELDIQNNRITRGTGHLVYLQKFYTTKYCICPGGSQVNSDRIADSIHYGCVPVILSNYYDLPFNDILNWRKFSVILNEHDVYGLKYILKKILKSEFIRLHYNLVKVGSIEGRVGVHHLDDSQQSKNFTFKCHREGNEIYSVNSLNFHPVHHTFATAGSDGAFNFWDKDSKQRLKAMSRCSHPIPCSAFNNDGSVYAYSVCYDWSKGAENHNPSTAKTYIYLHLPQESEVKGKPRVGTSGRK